MIKDLFGIRVIVNVNAINLVVLVNILDFSNCKCKKKLVDPLVEEIIVNIDETRLVIITVENENNGKCNSYVVIKVLFFI